MPLQDAPVSAVIRPSYPPAVAEGLRLLMLKPDCPGAGARCQAHVPECSVAVA